MIDCFGLGPHLVECKTCPYRRDCKDLAEEIDTKTTVYEEANDVHEEKWTKDKIDTYFYNKFSKEFPKYVLTNTNRFKRSILLIYRLHQDYFIDPKIYIDAQFYYCKKVCRARNIALAPQMLAGKKSNKRYEDYLDRNQNVTASAEGSSPKFNVELEYATEIVESILFGKEIDKKLLIKNLKKIDKRWNPKKTEYNIRIKTLSSLLDHFNLNLSKRITTKNHNWNWYDVGRFLKTLRQ